MRSTTRFHRVIAGQAGQDHADYSLHMDANGEVVQQSVLEEKDTELNAAYLVGSFMIRQGGSCELETTSAYGAAILMPQLARSLDWPMYLTGLTVRSYIFLLTNVACQFLLLQLIARSENVLDRYAGQMYLCNFALGARGPMGTNITAARTYPFDQWITRVFVRDSLKTIFPDRAEDIDEKVDPGEYALESHFARWACCFIFMMVTMGEFLLIKNMAQLLYRVPTNDDSWIEATNVDAEEEEACRKSWIGFVDIKIAGMPRRWKVIYSLFVLAPKILLWHLCCQVGIGFLMETSTIADLIVNAVAMAFVLNLDEMICSTLMSESTRQLLALCESFPLFDRSLEQSMGDEEILQKFGKEQQFKNMTCRYCLKMMPFKLVMCVIFTLLYSGDYYYRNCMFDPDGYLISKPMHLPKTWALNYLQNTWPWLFHREEESEPYWSMPEK
mmetsp:Transcript_73281/g.184617  ORF Transcript_73281/g.184617 Transcript_73281/m.184617 type:complete len:443 (-) Transcript_73281:43-1371(-)